MKVKILIWLDIVLPYFTMSKFLQENKNFEIYTIIDCHDNQKKFFQNQDIVDFKKKWFYRDEILSNNESPNIEYLKKIEREYNINLWTIAHSDVILNKYNQFRNFEGHEILSIFYKSTKLFETVLNEVKPEFLIIRSTDYNQNQILQKMCKNTGIKVLTIGPSRFGNRIIISSESDAIDNFSQIQKEFTYKSNRTKNEMMNFIKGYSNEQVKFRKKYRKSISKKISASIKFLIFVCNDKYRSHYMNKGRTRSSVILNEIKMSIKKFFRIRYLDGHSISNLEEDSFVYFPLQLEPERSTLVLSPFYTNQLQLIQNIAKAVPIDYMIYVKEHPLQEIRGWRETEFYKKISELPNVKILNRKISNEEIIKKCSLVITATGTAGLEAAFFEKPSIVMADVLYSSLNSVYRIKNLEELPTIIREALRTKIDFSDLGKYVDLIEKNSIDYDVSRNLYTITDSFFYYDGFLYDVSIPVEKMEEFIEKYEKEFRFLAEKFTEKIKQHSKYQGNFNDLK